MSAQQFSINRQVFEVDFFSTARAYELQNRLSTIANGELPNLMNRYFEAVVPESLLYKIDSLVLDIGEILYDNLETELPARIMEALMEELTGRFRMAQDPAFAQQSGIAVSRAQTGIAELFEYFLLTGHLPWWAARDTDIEAALDQLFHEQRQSLRELIVRAGRNDYVRRRLVNRFGDQHIRRIIETLEPDEAVFIFAYHKEVVRVQQQEQVVATEQKAFEKAVWLFILDYLLADRGGEFNRRSFVKSTLMQIAASFNVAYHELLHVFFTALHVQNHGIGAITSLEQLVRELSSEEEVMQQWAQTDSEAAVVPDAATVLQRLDVLRYYLLNGSLPSGVQGMSREQLSVLLFEVANQVPQTFREMLLAVGASREVSARLFDLLGIQGTRSFLQMLHPVKARSIAAVGSIFELLQAERSVLPSANGSFKDVLWKMMLDVALVSRLSITDDRVLFRSLVEGLRRQYGQPLQMFTTVLREGIRAVFYKNLRNLDEIALFQQVLDEFENTEQTQPVLLIEETGTEKDPEPSNLSRSLRDVLRFLLSYGSMPWWARNYFSRTPLSLLEELQRTSPVQAIWLFRFAGTGAITQQRFLMQFPEDVVLGLMRTLPSGETSIRIWEQMRSILRIIEPGITDQWMLELFWEEWIAHDYRFVTDSGLYIKAIMRVHHAYQREPLDVLAAMREVLAGWAGEAIAEIQQLLDRIEQVFQQQEVLENKKASTARIRVPLRTDYDFVLQEHLFSASVMLTVPGETDEVKVISEWMAGSGESDRSAIADKLFATIEQFLASGYLPDSIHPNDRITSDLFTRRLLLLAQQVNAGRLQLLFNKYKGVLALAHIAALVRSAATVEEKRFAVALQPLLEGVTYPFDVVPVEPAVPVLSSTAFSTEILLQRYSVAAGETSFALTNEVRYRNAIDILRYYLLWNRLPATLNDVVPANVSIKEVLNHLLLFVFRRNPSAFAQFIRDEEYQQSALETLHAVASTAKGNDEKEIASMLAVALRAAMESTPFNLNETTADAEMTSQEVATHSLTTLAPAAIDKRLADAILLDAASVRIISERKDTAMYDAVLRQSGYRPFSNYQTVLDDVHEWLGNAFTDTLLREQVRALFRRFNLQLAAGRQSIRGAGDFLTAFFHYIRQHRSPAGQVWEQLLKHLAHSGNPIAPSLESERAGMRKSLRVLLSLAEAATLVDAEGSISQTADKERSAVLVDAAVVVASEDDKNAEKEAAAERKKLEEQIARELEKERRRLEEEARRKALEKTKDKNMRLYIANAGLVILHPFFGFYFTRLGLMEKNVFVDEEKRARAVLLMQYLVTGREKFEEHELVLNKILCDMRLEEPLAVAFEPTQEEKDLSEELFGVLKQRWEKIKNSSVESIRASFLQREGALEEVEDNWNLRVEQRGYDMLLQTLPWAFGFIKLPWMNKILTVEWI